MEFLLKMNIYAVFALINFVFCFFFGLMVFLQNPKKRVYQTFLFLNISISIWSLGYFFWQISSNATDALFWTRILSLGSTLIPPTFLHWMLSLLNLDKKRTKSIIFLYVVAVFFLFFGFSDLFVKAVVSNYMFQFWPQPGILYSIYLFSVYIPIMIACTYLIFKKYRGSVGLERSRLRLVAFGTALSFFGGSTNFPLWYGVPISPVLNSLVALYPIFFGYSMTRYRFMDIRTIVKRSSVFALLIVIIGAVFALLSAQVGRFLNLLFKTDLYWLTSALVAIVITIIFQPLKNFLEKITDKFLFAKTYSASEVLEKINDATSAITNLENLLSSVTKIMDDSFHCSKILVALLDSNHELRLKQFSGFKLETMREFLRGKGRVLPKYFSTDREIQVIGELKSKYEQGEYKPKSKSLLYDLDELDVALVIPLFVKEKLIGVIAMGNKRSGDPYNHEDLKVIDIVAGQSAIAIENTQLYEEQKNFAGKLQKEVEKATKDLKLANAELQRLDQAKSEFLSIASHQLRTPLTIVKGYTSMMLEGSFGQISPIIKTNLEKVFIATERLISLVESLLNISRIEQGRMDFKMSPVDLTTLVEHVVDGFKIKAKEKNLKLKFLPDKKMPIINTDMQKAEEVISNIIDNALKYTTKGEIIVGLHQEGLSVVFSCQDTGIGIEPDDLPRLFTKFVRGKGMMQVYTEGTGLGLYFARMVIEKLGGRIWAESPGKDQGSKISFSLPMGKIGK